MSPFPVIASGGVTSLEDLAALFRLAPLGLAGAIVGKALYSGRLNYREALDAVRPIGSLVKPAVYLAALSQPSRYTLSTLIEDKAVDMIVMGTHGHGGITDVLIGSTAKRVVRQSTIPVLVIRLPEALP